MSKSACSIRLEYLVPICLLFFILISSTVLKGQAFTDVSMSSGVGFDHVGLSLDDDMPIGTGAVWFDYDNDGFQDLYITNRIGANKLFRNNGNGSFTNVAATLGVEDSIGDGAGVAAADINNDGFLDLYITNSVDDVFYRNDGGTGFTNIKSTSGINMSSGRRGTSVTFGDYDNDGFLDLYITHHVSLVGGDQTQVQDFLYHNNGNETFTDVSGLLDINEISDPSFIGGWTDYDRDGDLDIIVINDCQFFDYPNQGTKIFRNDGGTDPITDWTFTEVSETIIQNDCSNGMGLAVGDYNRDGWLDIVYSDIGIANLFKNNNGVFQQQLGNGFDVQGNFHFSWGTSFLDFNNDGWQDISLSVGKLFTGDPEKAQLFENNGDLTFTDVAPDLGIDYDGRTRTLVHGDYDNDGDLDLLMVNYSDSVKLFRNDLINNHNYFRVQLHSSTSAPNGIGSKLRIVDSDGVNQYFEMRSGSNLGGGDELFAHFGIGPATSVDSLIIDWMSGKQTIITNVGSNKLLQVYEPRGRLYVRETATGMNDGSSWANAYNSLQDAISAAMNGDSILVGDGTYYTSATGNKTSSFLLNKQIVIMGAFPAAGGTYAQRDITNHGTILSGDIGISVSERAYHIVQVSTIPAQAFIEGVKITHSNANGPSAIDKQGGGIWISGNLHLKDCLMENHMASSDGSAVYVNANGKLSMAASTIVTDVNQTNWIWMETNSVLSISDINEVKKE